MTPKPQPQKLTWGFHLGEGRRLPSGCRPGKDGGWFLFSTDLGCLQARRQLFGWPVFGVPILPWGHIRQPSVLGQPSRGTERERERDAGGASRQEWAHKRHSRGWMWPLLGVARGLCEASMLPTICPVHEAGRRLVAPFPEYLSYARPGAESFIPRPFSAVFTVVL